MVGRHPDAECRVYTISSRKGTRCSPSRADDIIGTRTVGCFEAELDGGEYSTAIENLVLTLINDKVPVSQREQEDLRRLLDYLRQPTTELDGLTRLHENQGHQQQNLRRCQAPRGVVTA